MSNRKIILPAALLIFLLILIGGGLFYYRQFVSVPETAKKAEEASRRISGLTVENIDENVNLVQYGQELEALLNESGNLLSKRDEGALKIQLADIASGHDRKKSVEMLKEVALGAEYPNSIRAEAVNFLVDTIEEFGFLGQDFEKQTALVFSGEQFGSILDDAGGDVRTAFRKLNEWSLELSPSAIAHYRLARWFATEIYKNPDGPKKEVYLEFVNAHIAAGDSILELFGSASKPSRVGLAYEFRARALHLSGNIAEAEQTFRKAIEVLRTPPLTFFQLVHLAKTNLFYAAFLARKYGPERHQDIPTLLAPIYDYLTTPQEPERKNVRLVSFLVAARDAETPYYPFTDFDRSDIARLSVIYPRTVEAVGGLNFREFIIGLPIEAELSGK